MAVQKNFIIRNGLEVNNNLLVADTASDRVGIGTSNPKSTFEVIGGIGATNINILGISTVLTEFNVGSGGTVITSLNTGLTGFGTVTPAYIVDIRSPVSTGQTALYVQGDVRVTGDLYADDVSFDQATVNILEVTGIGTIANFKATNVNVSGVTTTSELSVNNVFNVYSSDSTFHGSLTIDGNVTIGGTSSTLNAVQVRVEDKDIILGFTTTVTPSDDSANHGGIAIASTEGYPLISMSASGINTLPDTYKQIMWLKRNTMGAGTTDAFLFNYAVGVGSTQVPNGVRFAVGSIQFTDNVINTTNLNTAGVGTITTASVNLGYVNTGIVTTLSGSNLSYTGIGSFGSINADTGRVTTGIVTNLSGSNLNYSGISTLGSVIIYSGIITATSGVVTYYGDGQYLNLGNNPNTGIGIGTTGGIVGYGITFLDLKGAGVSTTFYNSSAGIATIFFEGGGSGTIGIGSTFPPFSNSGDLFYHINYGRTFVYYDEVTLGIGSTSVWVDASPFNVGLLTIDDLSVSKLSVSTNVNVVGVVTAFAFYGDGANLTNTGSSLSAASGTQRIVVTGQTSGTMTASATDADLTFNATTNTLSVPQSVVGSAVTINSSGVNATSGIVTASSFLDSAGNLRSIPQNAKTSAYNLAASDNGKHISITTGGISVLSGIFSIGDTVAIYNNSGSNQTITEGAGVTLRQSGTSNTGNRTLAQYGICTILCVASNTFVISGTGIS
jgi:hypothetical protein